MADPCDIPKSPENTSETPHERGESKKLREKIDQYRAENNNMSLSMFLKKVGFSSEREEFGARLKSISEFIKGTRRLDHHIRIKSIAFLNKEYSEFNFDPLESHFYEDQKSKCGHHYKSLLNFHNIKPDRINELSQQISGRFLLYKKPVNPLKKNLILRSYINIFVANEHSDKEKFLMAAEYQKAVFNSKEIGTYTSHDFYVGCCVKKDGSIVLAMRQLYDGAMKTSYFDNIDKDQPDMKLTLAHGETIETCDGYTSGRLATSKTSIRRIPNDFTFGQIDALIDDVPKDRVDDIIVNHVLGEDSKSL